MMLVLPLIPILYNQCSPDYYITSYLPTLCLWFSVHRSSTFFVPSSRSLITWSEIIGLWTCPSLEILEGYVPPPRSLTGLLQSFFLFSASSLLTHLHLFRLSHFISFFLFFLFSLSPRSPSSHLKTSMTLLSSSCDTFFQSTSQPSFHIILPRQTYVMSSSFSTFSSRSASPLAPANISTII